MRNERNGGNPREEITSQKFQMNCTKIHTQKILCKIRNNKIFLEQCSRIIDIRSQIGRAIR